MNEYLIMCRSLTLAQRCVQYLDRAGISSSVVKAPQHLTNGGCAYALRVYGNIDRVKTVLSKNRIQTGKIYRKINEKYTEI